MAVIIPFMAMFEDSLNSGAKCRTNRPDSKSRRRIRARNIVQICVGNRFKGLKKLFDAQILKKIYWNYADAPEDNYLGHLIISPKKDETWLQFALRDGFKTYAEFLEYFNPQNHPKKQSKYIFFEFKKIVIKKPRYQSLEVFMDC